MIRFYSLALLLPIVVPALVMAGVYVVGSPTFGPLVLLVSVLIGSGFAGALPYSFFALWAVRQIRNKDEHEIRGLAVRSPVLMVLIFVPFALLMAALESDVLEGLFVLIYAIPCILVLGYGYVALVFGMRRLMRNRAWTSTASQAVR